MEDLKGDALEADIEHAYGGSWLTTARRDRLWSLASAAPERTRHRARSWVAGGLAVTTAAAIGYTVLRHRRGRLAAVV